MPEYTQFKSVTSLGESLVSDQLETNIVAFFDWGFLNAEGFVNVTFPSRGTRLRPVSDRDYVAGTVWEGYRQGWVWETGVAGVLQPVAVSGVWVNGTFRPAGSGHHVDYPTGRVVFDAPLPSGSQVALEYSFRRVRMSTADAEWFQDLQFNTLETLNDPDPQFAQAGSGAWDVLSRNRVQLPTVVVEAVSRVRMTPLEIGDRSRVHQQDVLFHVLADTPFDMKQIHDIVVAQWDHRIVLFDKNAVEDADAWPLDERGTPRPGAMTYPALVAPTGQGGFRWRVCAVAAMRSEPVSSYPPLYRATCRGTMELDLP